MHHENVQIWVFIMAPPIFTSIDDLPAHSQHHLTVAGCIGHQVQHLLVGPSLHHHAVDADELISGSQTSILLCSPVWHDGPDVDLRKDVLMEGWRVRDQPGVIQLQSYTLRNVWKEAHRLLWTFSSQNPEAKSGLDVPLQENVNVFGVRLCGCGKLIQTGAKKKKIKKKKHFYTYVGCPEGLWTSGKSLWLPAWGSQRRNAACSCWSGKAGPGGPRGL